MLIIEHQHWCSKNWYDFIAYNVVLILGLRNRIERIKDQQQCLFPCGMVSVKKAVSTSSLPLGQITDMSSTKHV